MRTQMQVAGREVLAVWVKGAVPYLTVSGPSFTRAVRLSGMGTTQEKRNFLSEGGADAIISVMELQCDFHGCRCCRYGF